MLYGTCDFGAVRDCISGTKKADETVLESISVLSERLEKLQGKSGIFAGISFSDDAQNLASGKSAMAFC